MSLSSWFRQRLRRSLLILLLVLGAPVWVFAQETDRQEAFVYGINAGIPDAVIGTFAPPAVDTIYLISTETSILSPRITSIYYWPITNDYRASWNVLNEVVEGELEIMRGLQVVETVEQTTYTIHFRTGRGSESKPDLYIGADAERANAQFEADQLAYREALLAYEQARLAWLDAAREAQNQGVAPGDILPAPLEPSPLNYYSTGLNQGFAIKLEPGNYRIRTRALDGTIVPNSERRLVVFAPRRTAIGYEVVPEQRWTFPEESNDLEGAILGEANTVVYLKPFITREYPALAYARLQDPQDASVAQTGEWTWIAGEPIEDATLEQVSGERVLAQIPLQGYTVIQTPGGDYGYEILEYDSRTPEITPRVDFVGYRLPLASDNRTFSVQLRSPDGMVLADSSRAVRVSGTTSPLVLGIISLLPLLVGAGVLWWREQQTSQLKSEDAA
ncbi:MAG: hypothetical protein H6654_18010 [Ardenticatenaceae bacterium]|nr:hypothetical protein [Anaerolineales bacterium]MCB8937347.1 hypothetical protein [Ardenticatenaceae bacterium]MCB8975459.1 hypothetical protein [Ardenticatenaceae bacterium]